jgi:hypothetical protein
MYMGVIWGVISCTLGYLGLAWADRHALKRAARVSDIFCQNFRFFL